MSTKLIYPDTIVFDLDGTLIDSLPAIRVALNQVLSAEGIIKLTTEEVKEVVGFGAKWMINRVHEDFGQPIKPEKLKNLMDRYLNAYMENSVEYTLVYDGVYEVLAELKNAGVRMGICTNKPGLSTRPVLQSLKLDQFFGAIVTEDDVENRKPHRQHVLETIRAVKGDVSKSMFVGDSETDMAAAKNAGIPAICVTYGYCHVPYEDLKVKALLSDFHHLPKLLNELQVSS